MAKVFSSGLELAEAQLDRLGRGGIRRIVEAGSAAAQAVMQRATKEAGHVRTGGLMRSINPGKYYEGLNSGAQYVEFQGVNPNGLPYHDLAYIIDNGRGSRGDRFITSRERESEEAAAAAMQAESDRLLEDG